MKLSKKDTKFRSRCTPKIRFEKQTLTSFAGIVIFQKVFQAMRLKEALRGCFSHLGLKSSYGLNTLFMALVVHLILGWKRLGDVNYYRFDPMVTRTLGLRRLPDVSTMSRFLKVVDEKSVIKIGKQVEKMVIDKLSFEKFPTITLDYDGSVITTKGRNIEGTAAGFNKKKKGSRSY